jgi:hypothetical protein
MRKLKKRRGPTRAVEPLKKKFQCSQISIEDYTERSQKRSLTNVAINNEGKALLMLA